MIIMTIMTMTTVLQFTAVVGLQNVPAFSVTKVY